MPQVEGVFIQAESEVAAINMLYGAAAAGVRVMTSSSSPGISLKQEGISYMAGSELPCVIVNMVRGGPGLGTIQPAQSDYFQSVKGGGHGDYKLITLAPASIQEMVDMTRLAFDLADKYRNPVVILGDGLLGQMMEPVVIPEQVTDLPVKPWATAGIRGERERNIINSLYLVPAESEDHNNHLQKKFASMNAEVRYELLNPDADVFAVAYGSTSRIVRTAIEQLKAKGISVGLIRPTTLFPFPTAAFEQVVDKAKFFISVELSAGQMVEDVRLAVNGRKPVHFYGRMGGVIPSPEEICDVIEKLVKGGS
jgi:2-oxoglutarate ferredoxin oxidoreductase subunit alpha